jgi:hypothetical protein
MWLVLMMYCPVDCPAPAPAPVLQKSYYAVLESTVMWLVLICAAVAILQLIGLLGGLPHWARP